MLAAAATSPLAPASIAGTSFAGLDGATTSRSASPPFHWDEQNRSFNGPTVSPTVGLLFCRALRPRFRHDPRSSSNENVLSLFDPLTPSVPRVSR
jgi:hypothetical protein